MELSAPSDWRRIDCISDLHLLQQDAATVRAFEQYLASTRCDALFILGDLFEVWIGDDCLDLPDSFEAHCAGHLAQAADRMAVHLMHGNRDFLMGPRLAQACRAHLLEDPTVLAWAGARWVLSHGDALCLDDHDYQQFRAQVRSTAWQQQFLAQSLSQREAIARGIRQQSEARKREVAHYADVDTHAALSLLQAQSARALIHGHTHKPAQHTLDAQHSRYVLSDWDASAEPPRLEILRWTWSGRPQETATAQRIRPDQA